LQGFDQLAPEPDVGWIAVRVGVPIKVCVKCWDFKRKRQELIAELRIEYASVTLRHRQDKVGFTNHSTRGEVVLAAQPNATPPVLATKLEILCA